MTTLAKATVVTRETVGKLEHRFGRRRLYLFGGALLFIVLLLIVRAIANRPKPSPPPPPRVVSTAKVTTRDVPLYLDEIGTCAAFETVQVQAQVSGQITARNFQDGADVKKGDLLFTIDSRPYQALLEQAQGQLAQAKSQLVLDQITLKRQQELRARNVTSPQDLDTAQGTVNNDEAKVKSAEGAVAAAQVNVDYCNIRSPIDGRVGQRQVDVGNIVGGGSASGGVILVTIQGIDPIYTDFTIAEPDLPLVRKYLGGPNVKVMTDAEDDQYPPRQGDLSFIDTALQSGSGTVKARGITPNADHALWPSQFVHVRLILDILKSAKLVPSGAVQIGQNGPYIFVVKADSTLELRDVKPGQRQEDLTVITEGVTDNETVVVSGQLQLSPGAKVIIQQAQAPGQSGGNVSRQVFELISMDGPQDAGDEPGELEGEREMIAQNQEPDEDARRRKTEGAKTLAGKLVQFSSGLSKPFIQRPVMTTLLTTAIIVFGILTYQQLAVNDLPAVDYPVISVSVSYPGANPQTMANTVATPLEKQFTQIPGLTLSTSSSTQGNTSITLQFELSKSVDAAATDVQSAIQRASGQLPSDLPSPPTFIKTNPNDQAVTYLALTSATLTDGALYKYATTQVQQRINILPGVSQVNVYGVKGAIRIKANPGALASRNLTLDDVSTAVKASTAYSGAGQFDGKTQSFVLRPNGQIADAEGYRNIIIARGKDNSPVYLRDVADVIDGVQDERMSRHFFARGYNPPASTIVLAVSRQAGANAVAVAKSVNDLVPQLRLELPGSIQLIPTFDRSQTIVHSVSDVQTTLLIAFILVIIVIFMFLGRATDTLIPVVALPLSLLITFLAMWALNYSINNLTLMAMTLAIGFLVDDAIVFLENVVRRAEHGESIYKATLNSAGEISFTILSMTLSLAAVFIPLAFMPGLLGRIFREFSVTIIVAIFASGLVSLTLTPLMCARLLAERGPGHAKTWTERVIGRFFDRVIRSYGRSLDWFLDHGWLAAPIVVACVLGVWYFFSALPFTLLPTGDSGVIRGFFIVQEGASPQQQHQLQDILDPVLQANKAIDKYFTISGRNGQTAGVFTVLFLKDARDRAGIEEVAADIRKAVSGIPGIFPTLNPSPVLQINIGATGSQFGRYSYVLSGINPDEVYAAADAFGAKLRSYDGFVAPPRSDLFRNTPNVDINIDRDRASVFGVSTTKLQTLLRSAYSQNYVYLIKQADDQYQVILEVDDRERATPEDLSRIYVKPDNGATLIPVRALTRSETTLGLQSVNHLNQFTSVTFGFDTKPGVALGDVTAFIQKTAAETLPPTVKGELQGEGLVLQQLFEALPFLVLAALFVMYVILGILYESYVHPITVLSALFPAVVGGLLTLWLFRSTLSLYSVIGLFLLMGIVKKNGIMIVDFALHRLDEGYDRRSAIHEASVERFRPIIMTTLAALMGAVPLALGYGADGSSRRPLGLVIVGGLIISQLITLYITPVIYLALESFQERVLDKVPFLRSGHMHHEADSEKSHVGPKEPAPAGAH